MGHDDVGPELERTGVAAGEGAELVERLGRQPLLVALEGRVEARADLWRRLLAVEALPGGVDSGFLEQRHEAAKDLGHSADLPARADVQHPPPAHALREAAEELDGPRGGDVPVVLEGRHGFGHAPARTSSASATSRLRSASSL